MCWTCCIENLKAQIAKEDINVYKVVRLRRIYQTNAANLGDTYIVANIIGQIDKKRKQ